MSPPGITVSIVTCPRRLRARSPIYNPIVIHVDIKSADDQYIRLIATGSCRLLRDRRGTFKLFARAVHDMETATSVGDKVKRYIIELDNTFAISQHGIFVFSFIIEGVLPDTFEKVRLSHQGISPIVIFPPNAIN